MPKCSRKNKHMGSRQKCLEASAAFLSVPARDPDRDSQVLLGISLDACS